MPVSQEIQNIELSALCHVESSQRILAAFKKIADAIKKRRERTGALCSSLIKLFRFEIWVLKMVHLSADS